MNYIWKLALTGNREERWALMDSLEQNEAFEQIINNELRDEPSCLEFGGDTLDDPLAEQWNDTIEQVVLLAEKTDELTVAFVGVNLDQFRSMVGFHDSGEGVNYSVQVNLNLNLDEE